jgi:hypothetical protein
LAKTPSLGDTAAVGRMFNMTKAAPDVFRASFHRTTNLSPAVLATASPTPRAFAGEAISAKPAQSVAANQPQTDEGLNRRVFAKSVATSPAAAPLRADRAAGAPAKPGAAPKVVVMESFDLELDGPSVTIRDADGSVYRGALTAQVERKLEKKAAELDNRERAVEAESFERLQSDPAGTKAAGDTRVHFQVTGASLTLQLPVAFDGYFDGIQTAESKHKAATEPGLAAPQGTAQLGGGGGFGGGGRQVEQSIQTPAASGRLRGASTQPSPPTVTGRLVIGGTNASDIHAIAAPPGGK